MSNKPPGYFKAPKKSEWTGETGAFFDPKPVPDNRTANIHAQSAPPMTKEEWEEEKERIRKNASIANIGSIGSAVPQRLVAGYNETTGEKVLNRIDHPSDIEQAQEMVPTGMVLAVVGFVGFMLCALFWVVFQLVK